MEIKTLKSAYEALNGMPEHVKIKITERAFRYPESSSQIFMFFEEYPFDKLIRELGVKDIKSIEISSCIDISLETNDGEVVDFVIHEDNTNLEILNDIKRRIEEYKKFKRVSDKVKELDGLEMRLSGYGASVYKRDILPHHDIRISVSTSSAHRIVVELEAKDYHKTGLNNVTIMIDTDEFLSQDVSVMNRINELINLN